MADLHGRAQRHRKWRCVIQLVPSCLHITVGYRTVPSGTVRHPRVPLSALLSLLYSALLYLKKKGTSSSFANLPICFADVAIAFAKARNASQMLRKPSRKQFHITPFIKLRQTNKVRRLRACVYNPPHLAVARREAFK